MENGKATVSIDTKSTAQGANYPSDNYKRANYLVSPKDKEKNVLKIPSWNWNNANSFPLWGYLKRLVSDVLQFNE